MPNKSDLKPAPCPFCGATPEVAPWHGGGPRKHAVSCVNDACMATPGVTGTTKRRAIANWNWRGTD